MYFKRHYNALKMSELFLVKHLNRKHKKLHLQCTYAKKGRYVVFLLTNLPIYMYKCLQYNCRRPFMNTFKYWTKKIPKKQFCKLTGFATMAYPILLILTSFSSSKILIRLPSIAIMRSFTKPESVRMAFDVVMFEKLAKSSRDK